MCIYCIKRRRERNTPYHPTYKRMMGNFVLEYSWWPNKSQQHQLFSLNLY